ncbi:MAG: metallophosphoesterase [Sphingobacteriales bacterium]|nr:MAG: metallophosphoesterase [Sphingobacteriales bacterium]
MPARFIIPLILLILGEYYSFIVIRLAVRHMPPAARVSIIVFHFLVSLVAWTSFIFLRKINWAEMPHMARNIYVAFVIGYMVSKIVVVPVMLSDEIRRLIVWIAGFFQTKQQVPATTTGNGIPRSVFITHLAMALGGATLLSFIYGITNRYKYQVRRVKIKFDNLPASFRGLKIVQISDVHSGSFDSHKAVQRGIDKIMAERPDMIFFTGDLVNNKADEIQPYTDIFSQLRAPMGVYSTLGNHDYGDYVEWPSAQAKVANLEWLKKTHAAMGWRLLMNEHVILNRGNDKIAVIGIENWGAKAGFPKYGDMRKAYAGLPEQNVPFKMLLSHDPSHWDAQVRTEYKDIDIAFAGHTHGMQFGIEIPGFKWSPVQYVYRNWAGLTKEENQYLYVNRGFGFLGYPGRLGILPEITVIELV